MCRRTLLPLGMLGFGVNLITGMLFFLALPAQYTGNIMFLWKFILVVLAGFNDHLVRQEIFRRGRAVLRPYAAVHRERVLMTPIQLARRYACLA